MQKHNLQRKNPNKKPRQVGRGGTRGKTAGRGTKGQNARSGHKKRPEIRDFIKKIPKLRGRGKNVNTSIQSKPFAVNISVLEKMFKNGDVVSPGAIVKAGIVKKTSGANPVIKILATGSLSKKLTVKGCDLSASAKAIIEKAGGSVVN